MQFPKILVLTCVKYWFLWFSNSNFAILSKICFYRSILSSYRHCMEDFDYRSILVDSGSIVHCTIALDRDSIIDQDCSEMTLCCSSESRCKSGPTQIAVGPFLYLWKAKSRQKWTHDTISLWREAYICCILLQRKYRVFFTVPAYFSNQMNNELQLRNFQYNNLVDWASF